MREEEDEAEILHRIVHRLELASIDVDRVAQRLKGVEADADRQHDFQHHRRRVQSEQAAETHERIGEEIEILKARQHAEIGAQRRQQPRLPPAAVRFLFERQADGEVDAGREQQQHRKPPVPPAIKDQAGDHDQPVLPILVEPPVDGEDDDVEDNEGD